MKRKFNQESRAELFSANSILDVKLTKLRIFLADLMNGADEYSNTRLENTFTAIRKLTNEVELFDAEIANIKTAMANGKAAEDPNLSRPEHQLAWAAAMIHINKNLSDHSTEWNKADKDDKPGTVTKIEDAPFWSQLTEEQTAIAELANHARFISEDLRRTDIRFGYGEPGSGFGYSQENGYINVDFLGSLVAGFEHARGILFREIAHSILSRKYTDRSNEIRAEIRAIKDEHDYTPLAGQFMGTKIEKKIPPEAYIKMRKLSAEWRMRDMLWQAAEHNVHHAYTAEKSSRLAQDYSYSLNHDLLTVGGYGQTALRTRRLVRVIEGSPLKILRDNVDVILSHLTEIFGKDEEDERSPLQKQREESKKRFVNTIRAIEMAFFRNNDLFKDTTTGWLGVGVDPKLVKLHDPNHEFDEYVKSADTSQSHSGYEFEYLMDLVNDLSAMQPKPEDRLFGHRYYKNVAEDMNAKRNQIIEQIWDMYLSKDARILLDEAEEKLWKQLGFRPDGSAPPPKPKPIVPGGQP